MDFGLISFLLKKNIKNMLFESNIYTIEEFEKTEEKKHLIYTL